jgi:uncharacterized protein YegL
MIKFSNLAFCLALFVVLLSLAPHPSPNHDSSKLIVSPSEGSLKLSKTIPLRQLAVAKDYEEFLNLIKDEKSVILSDFFLSVPDILDKLPRNRYFIKFNLCEGLPKILTVSFSAFSSTEQVFNLRGVVDKCQNTLVIVKVRFEGAVYQQELSSDQRFEVFSFDLNRTEKTSCFEILLNQEKYLDVCLNEIKTKPTVVLASPAEADFLKANLKFKLNFAKPGDKLDIEKFQRIIALNLPAAALPRHLEDFENFLKKGKEIVFIGGNRSFSEGQYSGSKLENLLPVTSEEQKSEAERAKMAVMLLIDKSGSMKQGNRLSRVVEAIKLFISRFKEEDYLGLIGFDTTAFIVFPLTQVSNQNRESLITRLRNLRSWGGTDPLMALIHAKSQLENQKNASVKHIIVLTDGEFKGDTVSLINMTKLVADSGISLSGILIGDEDSQVLREMVKIGGGNFYFSVTPDSVPEIFLRDVFVRRPKEESKTERIIKPKIVDPTLEKFVSFPKLEKINLTRLKKGSVCHILDELSGRPILSSWEILGGKVWAFSADITGIWSQNFVKWVLFKDFLQEVLGFEKSIGKLEFNQFDRFLKYMLISEPSQEPLFDQQPEGASLKILRNEQDFLTGLIVFNKPGDYSFTNQREEIINISISEKFFSENQELRQNIPFISFLEDFYGYQEFEPPKQDTEATVAINYKWVLLSIVIWIVGLVLREFYGL